MAIASWMESKDVYPGIEAAVRRTEAIEAAAREVVDYAIGALADGRLEGGEVPIPIDAVKALSEALRGAA